MLAHAATVSRGRVRMSAGGGHVRLMRCVAGAAEVSTIELTRPEPGSHCVSNGSTLLSSAQLNAHWRQIVSTRRVVGESPRVTCTW